MKQSHYEYDFIAGSNPEELDGSYWMNGERLTRSFCQELPAGLADLLDIVMAVYAADRRSRRDFSGTSTGQRRIHVRIGVREPGPWNESEVAHKLQGLLYWLSEDEWSFQFLKRQTDPSPAESERFLFRLPPQRPATVALFSGGLDSIAGLAARDQEESCASYVLVSGYTHNRLAHQQELQVKHIRSSSWGEGVLGTPPEICHVAVPFGLCKPEGNREEKSQRTRALVYLTLGVATALQAGTDTLWVHENGVGALNLPLDATQLGVDNYRGVHPRSLMMVEDLFEMVLERPVQIKNPFLFHTKAEMCRALLSANLVDSIRDTVSCDSFPLRIRNQPGQCGCCTSCILRRQALYAGGLAGYDPPERYRTDVLMSQESLKETQREDLEIMRGQVNKFARCLASDDPWISLVASFPELARTHSELVAHGDQKAGEVSARFIRLYHTYVREWERFMPSVGLAA